MGKKGWLFTLSCTLLIVGVVSGCLLLSAWSPPTPVNVEFVDMSQGGGYVEVVDGLYKTFIPANASNAFARFMSVQEFYGGLFEVEMLTVNTTTCGSAFYLYGEYGPKDFDEIDIEVYGHIEDVEDIYAEFNPATVDFVTWVGAKRTY